MSLHLIRSKSVKLDLEYIAFVYIPYVARVINTQWIQCMLARGIGILCSGYCALFS